MKTAYQEMLENGQFDELIYLKRTKQMSKDIFLPYVGIAIVVFSILILINF
jgi:hypothetical protein